MASPIARADDVTDWNQHMLRAGTVGGTSPLVMGRVAAIVQASVFDAVNGIDRKYTPVHVPPGATAGASRRAAIVEAAYTALVALYPAQKSTFDARLAVSLTAIGSDPHETSSGIASGIAWGRLPRTASCRGAPATVSRRHQLRSWAGWWLENGAPRLPAFCQAPVLSSRT
jgi:hypothetical protein